MSQRDKQRQKLIVEGVIEAMSKQGFEGKAYRYLLTPMYGEARGRRTNTGPLK